MKVVTATARTSIGLGAMYPDFAVQFKNCGLTLGQIHRLQRARESILFLYFQGLLSEAEHRKAFDRLVKDIKKAFAEADKVKK